MKNYFLQNKHTSVKISDLKENGEKCKKDNTEIKGVNRLAEYATWVKKWYTCHNNVQVIRSSVTEKPQDMYLAAGISLIMILLFPTPPMLL